MQLRFTEEIVAVLADAIKPREQSLIVDPLALDIHKRALAERMSHERASIGDTQTRGNKQQRHGPGQHREQGRRVAAVTAVGRRRRPPDGGSWTTAVMNVAAELCRRR